MQIPCNEIDRLMRSGGDDAVAALQRHAAECPGCRNRIESWEEISLAARAMRREWPSPDLWPRIERALDAEMSRPASRVHAWIDAIFRTSSTRRIAMAACAALCLATLSAVLLFKGGYGRLIRPVAVDSQFDKIILTERALKEVETSEAAYIHSIDRLSKVVDPRLADSASPLMVNYREKLMVLDSAIEECRANIERNRFNAHLRKELLTIYQEKQRTLLDVTKEYQHENQLN